MRLEHSDSMRGKETTYHMSDLAKRVVRDALELERELDAALIIQRHLRLRRQERVLCVWGRACMAAKRCDCSHSSESCLQWSTTPANVLHPAVLIMYPADESSATFVDLRRITKSMRTSKRTPPRHTHTHTLSLYKHRAQDRITYAQARRATGRMCLCWRGSRGARQASSWQ